MANGNSDDKNPYGSTDPVGSRGPGPGADRQNPYAPTRHSVPAGTLDLADDLIAHIGEREFRLDDIFRVTGRLYRRYFWEFAGPASIFAGLLGASNLVLLRYMLDWMIEFLERVSRSPEQAPEFGAIVEGLTPYLPMLGAIMGLMLLLQAYLMLYTTVRAGERCRNFQRDLPLGGSLSRALACLPAFLLVSVLAFIPLVVGIALCYVPGVVLMVYFSMLPALIGIGGAGPDALGKCFTLLRDRFWKSMGAFVVIFVIYYVVVSIISYAFILALPQAILEKMGETQGQDPTLPLRLVAEHPLFYASQLPAAIGAGFLYSLLAVAATVMYVNYSRANQ